MPHTHNSQIPIIHALPLFPKGQRGEEEEEEACYFWRERVTQMMRKDKLLKKRRFFKPPLSSAVSRFNERKEETIKSLRVIEVIKKEGEKRQALPDGGKFNCPLLAMKTFARKERKTAVKSNLASLFSR